MYILFIQFILLQLNLDITMKMFEGSKFALLFILACFREDFIFSRYLLVQMQDTGFEQDYLDYLDYCMSYPGSGLLVVHQMYEQENFYIRPFIVIGNFFIIFSF